VTETGSYDKHRSHRDISAEIDRLSIQATKNWVKESRILSIFGLEDGMSVIELGSGPGFITEQLCELVPTSEITCIESDAELLTQAEDYLNRKIPSNNIKFVEGSVTDTNIPDKQFDFAYARLLFQHLSDPNQVTREIFRILKPGGKLIVLDIDDGLFGVFHPPIEALARIIEAFGQAQESRGGNRRIGRAIWKILESQGFHNSFKSQWQCWCRAFYEAVRSR